jgi:glycosyltransferase involved in cell wall biosynthesis
MPEPSTENIGDSFRVTVIIPCHNHASFLERSVDSVVTQDYENKKIIIINDGSSDNSLEVAADLSRRHDNIEVISNESPTGPSAARNSGIRYAWDDTDFFMMLDADDIYLPGKISKSVGIISKDVQNIGVVYSDDLVEHVSSGSVVLEVRRPYTRSEIEVECILPNTSLVSKFALSKTGLYDEDMRTAEDWDLWLRVTENFVAVHIPEPLSKHYITGSNSSDVVSKDVWNKNWTKIRERVARSRR